MADPTPDDHPLARLVLDYIRALLWPAMVLLAFVAMRDDIMKIVNTREVEIAGALKIGKSIDDLESKAQAEIDDLKRMVANLQAAPQDPDRVKAATAAVSANLEALERNIGREVAQIRVETAPVVAAQQLTPSAQGNPAAGPADPRSQAQRLEQQGFDALLERNLEAAIAAFSGAAKAWPGYHNVAEIERLLRTSQAQIAGGGDDAWQKLYRTILTQYSWGMPSASRAAMRDKAGGWY
jgi:hypothetical protein